MSHRHPSRLNPLIAGIGGGVGAALSQHFWMGHSLTYATLIGIGVAIGAYLLVRYLP